MSIYSFDFLTPLRFVTVHRLSASRFLVSQISFSFLRVCYPIRSIMLNESCGWWFFSLGNGIEVEVTLKGNDINVRVDALRFVHVTSQSIENRSTHRYLLERLRGI